MNTTGNRNQKMRPLFPLHGKYLKQDDFYNNIRHYNVFFQ